MLLNEYFRISSTENCEEKYIFHVELLPTHPVYQGHFPGKPVSPGVCNMQMIKECAETIIGHEVLLHFVKQYRMMAVMSPATTPEVDIKMTITADDNSYTIAASVWQADKQLIDFKGQAK